MREDHRGTESPERRRIALVAPPWFEVPPPRYGGVETFLASLSNALVDRGHDVVLIGSGRASGSRATFWPVYEEPPSERLGEAMPELLHASMAARMVRAGSFDLVHNHAIAGAATAGNFGVPTLTTWHHPITDEHRRYLASIHDVPLVSVSCAQRAAAPELPWIATVHNGVTLGDHRVSTEKKDYVLYLGRLAPLKGVHLAIDAARTAGVPITVAGAPIDRYEADYVREQLVPRQGDDVHFVGAVGPAAKQALLGGARCLVFPICWDEPFGLVQVEAMACGTPVVALRRGAVPEVVAHGRTGFIVDDPSDLPSAIAASFHLDPRACREHVETLFGCDVVARRHEAVYGRVLDGSPLDARGTSGFQGCCYP